MWRVLFILGLTAGPVAGCNSSGGQEQPVSLALVVSEQPIELVAPMSVLIQLLVIGADGEPVTITAPGAPAFVNLSGTSLTLAPTRADVGDHAVNLVATTATQQSSATLHVNVTRTNTGPIWLPIPMVKGTEMDGSERPVVKQATFQAVVCDNEEDNFIFQLEVVSAGTAFTGTPTASQTVDFAVTPPLPYELPMYCAEFNVPLTGLTPGDYDISAHAVDALGTEDPYGWLQFRGFTLSTP
jgi:hypothetical protein